jgi:hypothetical protein
VKLVWIPVFICSTLLVIACDSPAPTPAAQITSQPSFSPTNTNQPAVTLIRVTQVLPVPQAISCKDSQSFPVVPSVSEGMRALYQRGQLDGNNPRAFSKIGDGEISTAWFFTAFDLGEAYYDLGPFHDLAPVIEHFRGSFGRSGIAARRGFNTERILDPALSDPAACESGESPLTCELRLHRPAFAILSLGTNQVWQPEDFESGMRQILDILLSQGDNLEGDHRLNQLIACLAEEYDVPLWNFWSAIQPLPNHGLQPDLEHLTYGITNFDDEHALQSAWTVRNLTALQALDAVWRGVTVQP